MAESKATRLSAGIVLCGMLLGPSAHAVLYRCLDAAGRSVLTDHQGQLSQCVAVSGESAVPTLEPAPAPPHPVPELTDAEATNSSPLGAAVDSRHTSIPIQRVGPLMVVTVHLNGTRDARLILDTGASHTVLSHRIAADLGLFANGPTSSVSMNTAGGTMQTELVTVASIRLSDFEVRNTVAAIHDVPDAPEGVEGLLGLSVLGQFEMTLDAGKGELHLSRPGRQEHSP